MGSVAFYRIIGCSVFYRILDKIFTVTVCWFFQDSDKGCTDNGYGIQVFGLDTGFGCRILDWFGYWINWISDCLVTGTVVLGSGTGFGYWIRILDLDSDIGFGFGYWIWFRILDYWVTGTVVLDLDIVACCLFKELCELCFVVSFAIIRLTTQRWR